MRLHERALERWPVHALRTWACIGMLMIAVCAKAGVADATSQELPHTVAGLRLEALIRVFNGRNAAHCTALRSLQAPILRNGDRSTRFVDVFCEDLIHATGTCARFCSNRYRRRWPRRRS